MNTRFDYIYYIQIFHVLSLHGLLRTRVIPLGQLHGAMLIQMLVHVEAVPQQMRLVAPALSQALKLCLVEVVFENWYVVGVGALLDDDAGTLLGREATDIGETLLGDDDVEVMLGLIDMSAHGNNAGYTSWIGLSRTRRGCVHDGVLGRTKEVGGPTETIEHAATHDTC